MKPQTQHTPWKVDGNRIIQTFINESWNKQVPASREDVVIGTFNSCDQAEEAARAVNCHEELVKACQEAYDLLASKDSLSADAVEVWGHLEQAITKAEGR